MKNIHNIQMKKYKQKMKSAIVYLILSFLFSVFFIYKGISGSGWYFVAAIPFLLIFVLYMKPVINFQTLIIEGDTITISFWYGELYTANFAKALFQIVERGNGIVSYRFEIGGRRFQVTPFSYKEYEDLEAVFRKLSKKSKRNVEILVYK